MHRQIQMATMSSSQYFKVLQTQIWHVSQFLYDFLFGKKITVNYMLVGHFAVFKRYKFYLED